MSDITATYGRDLDLNLLRFFAVVAEEGSVTRAALRLYVTQPAVSVALRRLSSAVGAELFVRQGRGIVLTTRGEELLHATSAHLLPLVAAALAVPLFDPRVSTATVRLGLGDGLEALLLPPLLERLRSDAPSMVVISVPVQFRTVEEALLTGRVDLAVSVADELPRSILRRSLRIGAAGKGGFVCLHDARVTRLPRRLTEREYFAREHVIVSYAGDTRGLIEDTLGKARRVRVSVPAFAHVADVIDGSPLLATVPGFFAEHVRRTRPHLRSAALPFPLAPVALDLLWARAADEDAVGSFVRERLVEVTAAVADARVGATRERAPRRSRLRAT